MRSCVRWGPSLWATHWSSQWNVSPHGTCQHEAWLCCWCPAYSAAGSGAGSDTGERFGSHPRVQKGGPSRSQVPKWTSGPVVAAAACSRPGRLDTGRHRGQGLGFRQPPSSWTEHLASSSPLCNTYRTGRHASSSMTWVRLALTFRSACPSQCTCGVTLGVLECAVTTKPAPLRCWHAKCSMAYASAGAKGFFFSGSQYCWSLHSSPSAGRPLSARAGNGMCQTLQGLAAGWTCCPANCSS